MKPVLWDLPTRILHWGLALAVVLNLFFLDEGKEPHKWFGYGAVAVVALRFVWGFFGGRASRLRSLPLHPRSLWFYLRGGLKEGATYDKIHNPIASLVYVALWLFVLGMGVTGYMMGMDAYWGEDWVEEIHANLSTGIEILVIVHLLGVTADGLRYRRHTWLAMIRGHRG